MSFDHSIICLFNSLFRLMVTTKTLWSMYSFSSHSLSNDIMYTGSSNEAVFGLVLWRLYFEYVSYSSLVIGNFISTGYLSLIIMKSDLCSFHSSSAFFAVSLTASNRGSSLSSCSFAFPSSDIIMIVLSFFCKFIPQGRYL